MNFPRIKAFFFLMVFVFSPLVLAQQKVGAGENAQEASTAQARATLASLFGRGAKIPSIPRPSGTIALPTFDSSGMTIDEGMLRAAERGDGSSRNGDR